MKTTQELEIFESILEYFQKKKVVERIAKAEDKIEGFKKVQHTLEGSLRQLKREIVTPMKDRTISPTEVLEVCTICLMAGMDDFELLDNYEEIPNILCKVEGDRKEIADNFLNFLLIGGVFKEERLEDLIEKFYTQTPIH